LDKSYSLIIQATDDIHTYLQAASQKMLEIPEDNKEDKVIAQIDKLRVINIRDNELSYLCNRLYEVGQLYFGIDKNKAKQCFKDIVIKFTSYESERCNEKAKAALRGFK
jgi:hypothetical protein